MGMFFMCAMGKIEPGNIHPGIDHPLENYRIGACRTESADYLSFFQENLPVK
jgi:hypothetical protein